MYISMGKYGRKVVDGTNYGSGILIPINSKVTFKAIDARKLSFYHNGMTVMLVNQPKYTGLDISALFTRYFNTSKKDLSKFSKLERDVILNKSGTQNGVAKLVVGMSKEAVLVSRGYPPIHKTPNTKMDSWRYWKTRWSTQVVDFKDNKIVNITK